MMKIFYDGDCIFCENYVAYTKLKSTIGKVELVSLRSDHPGLDEIRRRGYKVNGGFVVEHNDTYYEGAAAFSYLNMQLSEDGFGSNFLKFFSTNERLTRIVYQFLVFGRYITLCLQGLSLIDLKAVSIKKSRFSTIFRINRIAILVTCILLLFSTGNRLADGDILAGAYSGLCLIFASVIYWHAIRDNIAVEKFNKTMRKVDWLFLGIAFTAYVLLVNAGYPLALRRFIGFFLATPLICLLIYYSWRSYRLGSKFFPITWLPGLAILFATIPGFGFGPFYGGIAGWVIRAPITAPVVVAGYQLVNDTGQSHWFSHAFFQPHGQIGRFKSAYLAMPGQNESKYVAFMFKAYKNAYPLIRQGKFPHQWALGWLAYPTHSLGKYETEILSRDFPPNRVEKIIYVVKRYTMEGNFIDSQIPREFKICQSDCI